MQSFGLDGRHFPTWLYCIATNRALDVLRHDKRLSPLDESLLSNTSSDDGDAPLTEYEIAHIRHLVAKLQPPHYAAVIQAYFWEGKSYADIANAHDTNINTISTWIRRAKIKLRKELA